MTTEYGYLYVRHQVGRQKSQSVLERQLLVSSQSISKYQSKTAGITKGFQHHHVIAGPILRYARRFLSINLVSTVTT